MNHYIPLNEYTVNFSHNPGDDVPDYENTTRVYKYSPDRVAVQIRGHQPLVSTESYNHNVKRRNLIAHITLSKSQIDELISQLQEEAQKLSLEEIAA